MTGPLPLLEGPVVVVTPAVAAHLCGVLERELARAMRTGDPVPEPVLLTIRAMRLAADAHGAARLRSLTDGSSEDHRSAVVSGPGDPVRSQGRCADTDLVGTTGAADVLGYTPRHVRWLAQNDRLSGVLVDGRWLFSADELDRYQRAS